MCLLLSKKKKKEKREKKKKFVFKVPKMPTRQLNRKGCLKNDPWVRWTQGWGWGPVERVEAGSRGALQNG